MTNVFTHLSQPLRTAGLVRDVVQAHKIKLRTGYRIKTLMAGASIALRQMKPPLHPRGLVPLMHCGFYNDASVYVPVAAELLRRGWQPIWVHTDVKIPFTKNSPFSKFNGGLKRISRHEYSNPIKVGNTLMNNWQIDFRKEIVSCNEDNYFLPIAGKLRRTLKVYDLDWENPSVLEKANEILHSTDATPSYCLELFKAGKKYKTPVRFIGAEHLYVPAGIPMMFSKYLKNKNLSDHNLFEFIDLGGAYSHYFTDGEYKTRSDFCVQNITRHQTFSRLEVLSKPFKEWVNKNQFNPDHISAGRSLLRQRWTGNYEVDPQANQLIEKIITHRKAGGKAAWMFGHAAVELGNPSDFGSCHPTLKDWIKGTVTALANSDTLLVVKPHPAEARYKPNRKPNQLFKELFGDNIAKNVIFLEPLWAPLDKIINLIDIGVVWRSSVGAQLTMQGIPVLICGMHTAYHQALKPIQPQSDEEYRELLLNPSKVKISPYQQKLAALYFSYLKNQSMIPVGFLQPPEPVVVNNFSYLRDTLKWNWPKLRNHISTGDDEIAKICDVICS